MNFNDKAYVHITICFGNQLVFMDCINTIRKIHLIFNSIFFNNGDWTIHGEWNIDDTEGKIYSACSQNFCLSNDLFFYMTFMNPLNRNDFNVNVILLFSGINDDFKRIKKTQYFLFLASEHISSFRLNGKISKSITYYCMIIYINCNLC